MVRRFGVRAPTSAAAAAALVVACSGATSASVADLDASAHDAAGATVEGGADRGDASAPADAATRDGDPASRDSSSNADSAPQPIASDPCPQPSGPPIFLDCDTHCHGTPLAAMCSAVTCDVTVHAALPQGGALVRTPETPGSDPKCAARCPGGSVVYGMGFDASTQQTGWIIRVGAPWKVIVGSQTPFCADAHAQPPATCRGVPPSYSGAVYFVTDDPNAPARNVTIEEANGANACPS